MRATNHIYAFHMSVLVFVTLCFTEPVHARTVYAIAKHYGCTLRAYEIQGEQIDYQTDSQIDNAAVGLALDPDSEILFATYDGYYKVVLVDAKTMTQIKSISTTDELCGIVFDQSRQRLYATSRDDNKLYVYLWNPTNQTLTLENGTYEVLNQISQYGAFGIALDEIERILYVTDMTNQVKYYDANDPNFGYLGNIEITVSGNDREAVAIDFYEDGQGNKYLYTGAWMHSTYHNYLVRTDITDMNNPYSDQNDVGAGVIGVAVDQTTGFVYITTSNNHIEVYSNATFPSAPCDIETSDIYGPADIIVKGDVLYKPPVFDVNKVDNVNDVDCAYPWNEINENYLVYSICYDANGFADTNVIITDHLPDDVNYISSEPCGDYNSTWHTVTWDINDISSADSNCLQLTVKVKQTVKPGRKIINLCEMEGDLYYKSTTEETTICCYGGDIIYVDKDANGFINGTSWLDAHKDLQDAFLEANNCGCEQIHVAEGTYKPTKASARSISFELLDGVAVYGGFAGTESHPSQRNFTDPNNETILSGDIAAPIDQYDNSYHVVKCVDVNNTTLDGFTITAGNANGSEANGEGGGIYCKDSNNFTVANCIIIENEADINGGGIYCKDSNRITVRNGVISQNEAHSGIGYGGGIYFEDSRNLTLTDCKISDNSAREGGAVHNCNHSDRRLELW